MKFPIRASLRPSFSSIKTFSPHQNPFPKLLPSKSVLQVRAFKLPPSSAISEDNAASQEKVAPVENAVPKSKVSSPTDHILGSSNLAKFKSLPKEEDSDLFHSTLQQSLNPLLKKMDGKWSLTEDKMGIERIYRFLGFKDTWNFMNAVAARCKEVKHHPEWVNIYNMVFIRWTTHEPRGLTSKDILMAKFSDEKATLNNEIIDQHQNDSQEILVEKVLQSKRVVDYARNLKKHGEVDV